jgi:hypothetical protein
MNALAISMLLTMSCNQYTVDMLYPLTLYANSRVTGPSLEMSAEVLDEDIQWLCEAYPNQTLGWALDLIQYADMQSRDIDGYTVSYE